MEGIGSNKFIILTDNNGGVMRMHSNRRMQASIISAMEHEDDNMYDVSLYGVPPSGAPNTTLEPIRAHKLILAFASKHLRDLLTSDNYTDSHKSEYHIENVDHESLSRIVQFIYTDQLATTAELTVEVLCRVLIGAKYLVMENLADACEAYLAGEESVKTENCVKLWCFARKYICLTLMHATSIFIVHHLIDMPKDDEFLRMPYDDCAKLLLSEAFVATNDDQRCFAAVAWLNHGSEDRSSCVSDIVNMIPLSSVSADTALQISECEFMWEHAPHAMRTLLTTLLKTTKMALAERPAAFENFAGTSGNFMQSDVKRWYVIGGVNNAHLFLNYDVERRFWSKLPDLPWDRAYLGACSITGTWLVAIGGVKHNRWSNEIDKYDLSSKTWSACEVQLESRNGFAACSVGDHIYIVGGFGDCVEMYNNKVVGTGQLASMHSKRSCCAAVAATDGDGSSYIYVAGGAKKIEKFDILDNSWSEVGEISAANRSSLAATLAGDDLYIMGGSVGSDTVDTVEIFNISTGKTRVAKSLLEARHGCAATTIYNGNVVCVVGGHCSTTNTSLKTVEAYDKREGKWSAGTIIPDLSLPTHYFGFATV